MRRLGGIGGYLGAGAVLVALASAPAGFSGTTAAARQTTRQASIVATARGKVPVYHAPGKKRAFVAYSKSNGYGQPRVFLVKQRRPGWEKVYLPQRPNGETGWVHDKAVTLAYDSYRVVVSLGAHRLRVYDAGSQIISTKAGVGRSVSATPRGTYFLVMLLKQPDPHGTYGPYAFGTSAFSNTYYHFGGGPGEIGLHGTNDPQGLGTNVSHGCIRVSNATITRLAKLLPLGTPVVITN
jgi:lipoprotein-anchoring transpeptidase ErfK/SrfK